jgi:phage protein D
LPPNKLFRGLSPKKDSTKLLPLDNIAMTPDQNPSTALSLQKMDNHAWHITGSRDCSKRHKQNLHVKKSDPSTSKTLQKHMHAYIHGTSQVQRIGVTDTQTRPPRQDK